IAPTYYKKGALYTTADGNAYFGWKDAGDDDARQLAVKFVERFPAIAAESKGSDWVFVGWYASMLGWAEAGHLPQVEFPGLETFDPPPSGVPIDGYIENSPLKLPPGGDAAER